MKRLYVLLCAVGLIAITAASCSLDDDGTNFRYTTLRTVSANLPDTFEFGRIYNVEVELVRPDDCTSPETFNFEGEFRDSTNVRTVAAIGIVREDADCTVTNDSIQDTFQFDVRFTEPYLFRFYTGDDENGDPEFLEIEVPVK